MSILSLGFLPWSLFHHSHSFYDSTQSNNGHYLGIPIFVCSRTLNYKGGCYFLIQSRFEKESDGNHIY